MKGHPFGHSSRPDGLWWKRAARKRGSRGTGASVFSIQPKTFASKDEEAPCDCSWKVIARAIRRHALSKSMDEAVDLNRWADLLDGIAALDSAKER